MKITTTMEELDSAMVTVSAIVSDKHLKDDLKNVIFWVKGNRFSVAAYNGNIVSLSEIEGTVELPEGAEENQFFQLRAKEVNDVLNSFKGLRRTRVDGIEFVIGEREAVMNILEEPISDDVEHADKYRQKSNFRIAKPPLSDLIKKEVMNVNLDVEGETLPSADLMLYVNSLYPTVQKEVREANSWIMFSEEDIYTFLPAYVAIMPNKLPPVFSNFRLLHTTVNFLKNFIANEDQFIVRNDSLGNGGVMLTFKVGKAVATIKSSDMSRSYDITNFRGHPSNGVAVDKAYLMDVLKRMSLSSEPATVQISISGGVGTLKVQSKSMNQEIPVVRAKGEGDFSFSIKADLLSTVSFSHFTATGEHAFIYIENGQNGRLVMTVSDDSNMWYTKMTGLAPVQANFAWS